jgi:hypothetical protein
MEGTMKQVVTGVLAAAALGALAGTSPAQAQSTTWWEWAAPVVVGGEQIRTRGGVIVVPETRRDRDRDRDRRDSRARGGARSQGEGPAFCRSGEGHPVHGRQWCVEKGWGLGNRSYDPRWERRRWEDVVFGAPRDRRRSGVVDQRDLADVLGSVVFGRLQGHQRQLGARGPVEGRWTGTGAGGRVLQVRAGGTPIAELTDLDGDGRVDLVLVYRGD